MNSIDTGLSQSKLAHAYLEALEINAHEVKQSPDFLNRLIKAHLNRWSFNNLEVQFNPGKILNLDVDSLSEKIIVNGRGGYCFELNQLCFLVLRDLGFSVRRAMGRVVYGTTNDVPRTHQVTLCELAGDTYLIDVGFGAYTPPLALLIRDNQQSQDPKHPANGEFWVQTVNHNGQKIRQLTMLRAEQNFVFYSFDEGIYTDADFMVSNFYTNQHPQSKFVNNLVMSIRAGERVHLIRNLNYSILHPDRREDSVIKSGTELLQLLNSVFNITVTADQSTQLFSKFQGF